MRASLSAGRDDQRAVQGRIDPPTSNVEDKESVELATLEWVSWFNHHRLLEPIGYIPPAEAEANYYRQLASQVSMVVA